MKKLRSLTFFTAALPLAAAAAGDALPIAPPADARLVLAVAARGVQIYECRDQAWAFVAPEAVLFDAEDRVVGSHGAGPYWQLADGSRIGARVKARVVAPGGREIPWLLLTAVAGPTAVPGALTGVSYIQRLNTRGGQAPVGSCLNQQSVRVAYTADYLFYRQQPAHGDLPPAVDSSYTAQCPREPDIAKSITC